MIKKPLILAATTLATNKAASLSNALNLLDDAAANCTESMNSFCGEWKKKIEYFDLRRKNESK